MTPFFPHTYLVHGGNKFWLYSLAGSARLEWGGEAVPILPLSPLQSLSKRKVVNDRVRLSLATFILCSATDCMFVPPQIPKWKL